MISRIFQKKRTAQGLDIELLSTHLSSVKVRLMEIRSFEKKRMTPSPTHVYWKAVDIEDAWPSCKEFVAEMYGVVADVSRELCLEPVTYRDEFHFRKALDVFIGQIDRMQQQIERYQDRLFTKERLRALDEYIMMVQHAVNRLHKHVLVEFRY